MATRRKHPVYRVTDLLTIQPDDELDAALKAAINENLSDQEKSVLQVVTTIVPSCYNSEHERVALVEFRDGVPSFLAELRSNPLGDWQIEMGDTDISFDCHFFGFTQLYKPRLEGQVTAEYVAFPYASSLPIFNLFLANSSRYSIIAITGLDGHAYGSWRGKGNLGRMWLRDFLSKDLPNCRTMTYGYTTLSCRLMG